MAFVNGSAVSGRKLRWGSTSAATCVSSRPRTRVVRMDFEDANSMPGEPFKKEGDVTEMSPTTLLRSDILESMRVKFHKMGIKMRKMVKEERYLEAAKLRDEMIEIENRDPVLKYEKLFRELKEKEKEEDFKACIDIRDEMVEVKKQVPHFNMEGVWKGNTDMVAFSYDGLRLHARMAEPSKTMKKGEKLFEADMSFRSLIIPPNDEKLDLILKVLPGLKAKHIFYGKGTIAHEQGKGEFNGYFITFDRSMCAFVFSELSVVMLFQKQ